MVYGVREPTCVVCGCALTALEARAGGVCGGWRCREAKLTREAEEERARAASRLRARGAGMATPASASERVKSSGGEVRGSDRTRLEAAAQAPIVIVPWRRSQLRPLPRARRFAFLAHLAGLLEDGDDPSSDPSPDALPNPSPNPSPDAFPDTLPDGSPDPVLAGVCAACQGACCHAGGTHAFLDRARIGEVRERLGSDEAVRSAYRTRLPARTVQGSCVFHTEHGCRLPRELRGNLCNRYECHGLMEARAKREDDIPLLHVVRRADQRIHDSAFVDEERVERIRAGNPRRRGIAVRAREERGGGT